MDRFLPLSYLHAQVAVEYLDMAPPAGESRPNENSEEAHRVFDSNFAPLRFEQFK